MAIRPDEFNCLLRSLVGERTGKSSQPCLGPVRVTCSLAFGLDGRAILFQHKCKRTACQLHLTTPGQHKAAHVGASLRVSAPCRYLYGQAP